MITTHYVGENSSDRQYNLAGGIGEHTKLSDADAAKCDELLGGLIAWMKVASALRPSWPNPKYDANVKPVKVGFRIRNFGGCAGLQLLFARIFTPDCNIDPCRAYDTTRLFPFPTARTPNPSES